MKRQFAAIALTCFLASPTAVLAADAGSYKPGVSSDQPAQKPETAPRKSRLRHMSKNIQELPRFTSGCYEERTFDAVGDSNSSFDPVIGCSTQANLSAMTENRGDLVRGRGTRYSDGERASHVVQDYRAWKPGAAPSQDASKTTSTQ